MKKLIILALMIFAFGMMAKTQTSLQWLIEENHYENEAGDSISIYLYTVIPIADVKNTTQKYILVQKKNGIEQINRTLKPTVQLDDSIFIAGQGKRYIDWLSQFMTINVASLKVYSEEFFKQNVDSTGQYINFE